jgi:hypothetical protein
MAREAAGCVELANRDGSGGGVGDDVDSRSTRPLTLFCLLVRDMSTWDSRFWKSPVPVLGPLGRLINHARTSWSVAVWPERPILLVP